MPGVEPVPVGKHKRYSCEYIGIGTGLAVAALEAPDKLDDAVHGLGVEYRLTALHVEV